MKEIKAKDLLKLNPTRTYPISLYTKGGLENVLAVVEVNEKFGPGTIAAVMVNRVDGREVNFIYDGEDTLRIKPVLSAGDIVNVYNDPKTQTSFEGEAKLIRPNMSLVGCNTADNEHWFVKFTQQADDDEFIFMRNINTRQAIHD